MSDFAIKTIVTGSVTCLIIICITLTAMYAMRIAHDIFIDYRAMTVIEKLAQLPNSSISLDFGNTHVKKSENGVDTTYNRDHENGAFGALGAKNIGDIVESITKLIPNIHTKK